MSTDFIHGVETVEVLSGTRPIAISRFSVTGIIGVAENADADAFPLNTPVLVNTVTAAAGLGDSGSLVEAVDGFYDNNGGLAVIVRVAEGADEAATLANLVGDAAASTGVHAFLTAQSLTNVTPRILIAPGYSHQRPEGNANPVVAELKGIADKLRAVFIVDGPNTTDVAAIAVVDEIGTDRGYLVDPMSLVFDTESATSLPSASSSRVAGLMSSLNFWVSPSNQLLNGITGTARPIVHLPQDAAGQTNVLNEAKVTTIIQRDGFRLWGNRGCGSDPLTAFISVRRTMDVVAESLEQAHDWAIDKPISQQLVLDIIDSVNAFLRNLRDRGAILGGEAFLNPDLNTPEVLKSGQLYIDFDMEPAAPLERLTFTLYRNDGYYTELTDAVLSAA